MRNGAKLKACISLSVLSLQEDGELHRLKKKWWHDRSECGQDKAKVNVTDPAALFTNKSFSFTSLH